MNWLFCLATGFYRILFVSSDPERILNYILEKNIPVWNIKREEGGVSFSLFPFFWSLFRDFQGRLSPEERLEKREGGTLRLRKLFGKRWGFLAGLALFAVSLYFSTFFVWGIEISGNSAVPVETIREELSQAGLRPGALFSRLDLDEIALRYQIRDKRFLYVNCNPVGTKVYVEVRERDAVDKTPAEDISSNLVAKTYGTVMRYEVLSGQIEVKKGDLVPQGALLISGVKETKNGSFYTVRAQGRVFAETVRTFEEKVLYEQTETVFTGRESARKSYEILGLRIPIPSLSNGNYAHFRKVVTTQDVSFFGLSLPVREREEVFLETGEKKEVIDVDRAEKLAYDKYEEFKRDTFAEGDEILEETASFSYDETGVTLTVSLRAVENICREEPFSCVFPAL